MTGPYGGGAGLSAALLVTGDRCPAGAGRPPRFPEDLQARFGERRFAPVDPPDFLDYEGAELILIGAAGDPARGPGENLGARRHDPDALGAGHDPPGGAAHPHL